MTKRAIITGSTSGIGLGIAEKLASQGIDIVLNGFGEADAIEALRTKMAADHGVTVTYSAADMSKPDEIAAMVAEAGGCDILVNNAGIQHVAPIDEFPLEKLDAIIAINMMSAFHAMRAAIPGMKAKGWGRIVNIASAHGLVASPNKSVYVMAKHGVVGLTKTAALELGPFGITVNAVCPGYVDTPLVRKQIPDSAKANGMSEAEVIDKVMLANHAVKEFVTIDQVAAYVAFLCSDDARTITGGAQTIDAGWTAR